MQEKFVEIINTYKKEKNINYELIKEYNRIMTVKTNDIVIDVDLFRYILLNYKGEKSDNYEYFYFTTKSFKFYFSSNGEEKDLELFYSNIIETYHNNPENFYKFVEILHELDKKGLVNVIEYKYRKENSDEIKIFSKFLFYYIKNFSDAKIDFDNFIYCKKLDELNNKNNIIKKITDSKEEGNKMIKILKECSEVLDIFDEIYDTKIFTNLNKYIVEFDKIYNNKLLITNEGDKFIIEIVVKSDIIPKIDLLIKKIKNIFKEKIEIILFVDEYNIDSLYLLFKEDYISHLIIKNSCNKNLLMLNKKNIFIYYDSKEENKTIELLENECAFINKYLDNFFETLYFVFNQKYKIHKIKIGKNLTTFGFYIKDRVEQNYFNINEYKEEKHNYSLYLYSKDNSYCYEIFLKKFPNFEKVFSFYLKKEINIKENIKDNLNSLIAIKGYDLMIISSKIIKAKNYEKIIFQESIEIEEDYSLKSEFEKILNQKNCGLNTRNIYIVDNIENYLDDKNNLPLHLSKSYNKRGFNDLLPAFYFIFKKFPILDRKPILLQISYFMSYKLNIYKNLNDNE